MPNPDLSTLLDQLRIPAREVTRLVESSFGSKVYRIDAAGRPPVVLKLFHGDREYWRERKSLELLEPAGLVPRVLDGIPPGDGFDGALLLELLEESANLASTPVDAPTARATGALLARIHGHADDPSSGKLGYFGPKGFVPLAFDGWWSFRRDLLGTHWARVVEGRMGAEFVRRCLDHLARLSASFRDDEATCLTHCDFRFGNVLRCRDGALTAIDFESARFGDGAYDFIKIWEQLGQPSETPEWRAFLQGYAEVRPLPPDLPAKLRYYWFDVNYGLLYWAIDRDDEPLFERRLAIVRELLG